MSPIFPAAIRLRVLSTLATMAFATSSYAQAVEQTEGSAPTDYGGMMGGGWGMTEGSYGMGGYGLIGVLVLALVVIAIAILAFRRRQL